MTEQEIVEIIATKIMGWTLKEHPECGLTIYNPVEVCYAGAGLMQCFNPFDSDYDCMRAWDRFSTGRITELYRPYENANMWAAGVSGRYDVINSDRRTAMIECMIKEFNGEKMKTRKAKPCPCCGNKNLDVGQMSAFDYGVNCWNLNGDGCGLNISVSLPNDNPDDLELDEMELKCLDDAIERWNKRCK